MQYVFPDYYKDFKCIAGSCRHNCCIGWEIDIDSDTAAFYNTVPGEMGKRLHANISHDDEAHFILDENERCPFLNEHNLCDIIMTLGEEYICGICTDHPRFRNELPGRIETGLGLCCEEAARLILGKHEPITLEVNGDSENSDEIISIRDRILVILQDRRQSLSARVHEMLQFCGTALPQKNIGQWAEILLTLERLDNEWTRIITLLRDQWKNADFCGFENHMSQRQTEYEQLLVYFIYRHMANAPDKSELALRAEFAALGYVLLYTIGAVIWTETGNFTFEQQVELARLFSSEIEYSDENLDILLDELFWKSS